MIASRFSKRTCAIVAILGLSLGAVKVLAHTYTFTGASGAYWNSVPNWSRSGCATPCEEIPDDTTDIAKIETSASFLQHIDYDVDDLVIKNGDVRLGPTGSGTCTTEYLLQADSVEVSAESGPTKLRGAWCSTLITN